MYRAIEQPFVGTTKIVVLIFSKAGIEFTSIFYLCIDIATGSYTNLTINVFMSIKKGGNTDYIHSILRFLILYCIATIFFTGVANQTCINPSYI